MTYDVAGRWAVNDPHWSGGLIVGFYTAREAKDYINLVPRSVLVRLPRPHFHGPWSKWWKRRYSQVENDASDESIHEHDDCDSPDMSGS